ACPTLSSIARQMTDGQQFILGEFGNDGRPSVAWHVDPFGHSYVTGGLWSQVGFDAFAMHRINYRELNQRKLDKNLEFVWKGSSSLGEDGYIWVHLLDSAYRAPSQIFFFGGSQASYIQTDPRLPSYPVNYVELAESFISDTRTKSSWFRHEHILIPFGADFAHQNAYESMNQMDKLIKYVNSNATYNATMIYSTLAEYVSVVNALNLSWNLETNDFYPYADMAHSWWTGYFTSRPQLKQYVRSRENVLRPAEQCVFNETEIMNNITYLRHALDSAQHHDAVSGTATQNTTNDYMYMLQQGTLKVIPFTEQVAPYFLKKGSNIPTLVRDESLISSLTSDNVLVVVLYNSLGWNVTEVIEVPSNVSNIVVFDALGQQVLSQVNPVAPYAQSFDAAPSQFVVLFLAQLPPLSFTTYFIALRNDSRLAKTYRVRDVPSHSIGNGYYTLNFTTNPQTNGMFLSGLYNYDADMYFALNNTWLQYMPTGGTYSDGLQVGCLNVYMRLFFLFVELPTNLLLAQNSGAYVFRPAQDNRYTLSSSQESEMTMNNLMFRTWIAPGSSLAFLVATHGESQYNDTFIATVCGYSLEMNQFEYRYYRIDNQSWAQNPSFDFLVLNLNASQQSVHFRPAQSTVAYLFFFIFYFLFYVKKKKYIYIYIY
ncbi:hypothetical protein RFI_17727, partial [Reticulomyxa filosa]